MTLDEASRGNCACLNRKHGEDVPVKQGPRGTTSVERIGRIHARQREPQASVSRGQRGGRESRRKEGDMLT